ncbi:hypothetical protein L484_026968 [Morus notabilis]|uniref:Uncharacterized protein n=1 Tax=Morus notabilis TaxID=981085 RepID=W9R1B1_9ROSA|nr:hypothetical protein L484_026968 [Morus notabilis]
MEEEGIGLVLARATELRLKIGNCIHKATNYPRKALDADELLPQNENGVGDGDDDDEEEEDDDEAQRLLNICDALESLESQLSSLQLLISIIAGTGRTGWQFKVKFCSTETSSPDNEVKIHCFDITVAKAHRAAPLLSGSDSDPEALQQQQRYEREAALAEIEQSRKTLLDKLKDYKGEQLEVINEASAFAGETVERNNDLLLPPYPTRPPQSLRRDNGYLPSLHKIVRNGVTSGDATNGEKKDPHELERNKNSRGMGSFLGVAAKTVLTLVGVVSVLSLSGFGPKFSGRETPLKLLSFFNQQASEEKRSSINCPPGKILVVENGEARCLVKERVEVPFSSAAAKPDVNYGCVSIEEASTIPLDSYKGMKHYLEELLERKSVKREDALKSIIKGLTFYSNSECLLAIIIDNEDNEYEIYRELLPVLSKALKSGPKPLKHSSDVLHVAISAWLFLVASLDGWRFSYNRWQGAISSFLNLLQNGDPSLSLIAGGRGSWRVFLRRTWVLPP